MLVEKFTMISDKLIEHGSDIGYWIMNKIFRKPVLAIGSIFCPKNKWALKLISRTEITHPNVIARDILFALVVRYSENRLFADVLSPSRLNEKELLPIYCWAVSGRSESEALFLVESRGMSAKQLKAERKAIDIINAKYCAWIVKNLEAFTLHD